MEYPAPGSPSVANEVKNVLTEEGFKPGLNSHRGKSCILL